MPRVSERSSCRPFQRFTPVPRRLRILSTRPSVECWTSGDSTRRVRSDGARADFLKVAPLLLTIGPAEKLPGGSRWEYKDIQSAREIPHETAHMCSHRRGFAHGRLRICASLSAIRPETVGRQT